MGVHAAGCVYRHYLYLDGEEVLNGLSALLGGAELERLETAIDDLGGNVGAKFPLYGASLSVGVKGNRRRKREVRLRATIHSQVERFLQKLEESRPPGIRDIRDRNDLDRVREGILVRFRARLQPLGEGTLPIPAPPAGVFDRFLLLFGWDPVAEAERERIAALDGRSCVVAVAELLDHSDDKRSGYAALEVSAGPLSVDRLDRFSRMATVVGQVEWKAADDEVLVTRTTSNAISLRVVPKPAESEIPGHALVVAGDRAAAALEPRRKPASLPSRWHPIQRHKLRNDRSRSTAPQHPPTGPPLSDSDEQVQDPHGEPVRVGVRPLLIFR